LKEAILFAFDVPNISGLIRAVLPIWQICGNLNVK
jgi:hypothetical protein